MRVREEIDNNAMAAVVPDEPRKRRSFKEEPSFSLRPLASRYRDCPAKTAADPAERILEPVSALIRPRLK
jgi:hypothetical protein